MNIARMWKIITAVFMVAGLLVAVPAESQALTPASAGLSSTGVTGAALAAGSAAVVRARNPSSWPAVTPGEVRAALARLSGCGCPPNAGEVEYALKQLGVKSLSLSLLVKRLGKVVGDDTFVVLVDSLTKQAAKAKKRVPFPNRNAKSATEYAKSPYRVYEIYGTSKGPGYYHDTWKYGITRQLIPAERPERQLPACTRYYGSSALFGGRCRFDWVWIGVGWLEARTVEASFTLYYAIFHDGKCPPGMPACV